MKIISIANHKGGVGKTTSSLNIGAGLARLGQRVLLIDLDPQMNLSQGLGVHSSERSIYEAMTGRAKLSPVDIAVGLSLVPSSGKLTQLESEFVNRIGGQVRLRKVLSEVGGYDFIIIDCPPSLGLLTINSFSASDEVIIPLCPGFYSVEGLVSLRQAIDDVRESLNPDLKLSGVLLTQFDKRKIIHRDIAQSIEAMFGDIVFKTRIRPSVSIEEAPCQGLDIFKYAPTSNGAIDYGNLSQEILSRSM